MSGYPRILHNEEAMREGMQIESARISVQDKIRLLDALSETGLKEIAVGSFASPRWTPQMTCIDELIEAPIRSYQRPDSMSAQSAAESDGHAESASVSQVMKIAR